jgi:hypothetical protein
MILTCFMQILKYLPENGPQRAETCRRYTILIVKSLYCNVVHLLVIS